MKRVDVFKRTTSDWYPSYHLSAHQEGLDALVRVSFIHLADREFRVCCWGDDDMGLERDYENESEAWSVFLQIIGKESVEPDDLVAEFQFVSA